MFSLSVSDVKGPVATITGVSPLGISDNSSSITLIFGWFLIVIVVISENLSLSTANAPPAGTCVASAHFMIKESSILISSFNKPTAFVILLALNEFEHTNSAKFCVLCAGVIFFGRIS